MRALLHETFGMVVWPIGDPPVPVSVSPVPVDGPQVSSAFAWPWLADTPDGAWAEIIRHEEIREAADLTGIRRALWAIEIPDPPETAVGSPAPEAVQNHGSGTVQPDRASSRAAAFAPRTAQSRGGVLRNLANFVA